MKKGILLISLIGVLCFSCANCGKMEQKIWSASLVRAIEESNIDEVEKLLNDKEKDINKKGGSLMAWIIGGNESSPSTPFEAAIYNQEYEAISLLLDAGANPYTCEYHPVGWLLSGGGGTWEERHACVKKILEIDPGTNYVDEEGSTTLTCIAGELVCENDSGVYSESHEQATVELYKYAETMCEKEEDIDGTTVLHTATAYGRNLLLIQYLVEEKGYSVDITNQEGETPLILLLKYYDAEYGSKCNLEKIIEFYIEHGADIHKEDHEGKSAYDYALENEISLEY